MKYKLARVESGCDNFEVDEFENKVCILSKDGWILLGPPIIGEYYLYQTMIKLEGSENIDDVVLVKNRLEAIE